MRIVMALVALLGTVAIVGTGFRAIAQEDTLDLAGSIGTTADDLREGLENLADANFAGAQTTQTIVPEVVSSLNFAREAIEQGKYDLAIDTLGVAKGMVEVAIKDLPDPPITDFSNVGDINLEDGKAKELETAGITSQDVANVQAVVERMSKDKGAAIGNVEGVMSRLDAGGFDVARLEDTLDRAQISATDVVNNINLDFTNLASLSDSLANIMNNPSMMNELSRQAGQAFAQMGTSLDTVANSIASAVAAGASVDLESLAQGAGFDNFSAAVDAYNEAHGTNYTEQQARDALGL